MPDANIPDIAVDMTDKPKLWTRTFITLTCINFLCALSFYLLMVKITSFALATYDVSYSLAGSTVSIYVIGALITRIFLGNQIDRWGIRKSLIIGLTLNASIAVLYFFQFGMVPLLVVRFLHGIGFGISSGATGAAAALIIPAKRRGEGIGYFSMAQALATGVGPFIAIMLTGEGGSYTTLFVVTIIMGTIALGFVFLLKLPSAPPQEAPSETETTKRRFAVGTFLQLAVVPLTLVLLCCYFCYSGIMSFLTVFADAEGLSQAASFYFIFYAIIILLTRPSVGRRVDRKGENSVVYFSLASLGLGFVVLALAVNGPLLLLSGVLIGFGIGSTQSVIQAVIVKMTPPSQLGRANQTFYMSMDLGSGVGPIIIGAFIPFIGYRLCWLVLAVIGLIALVLYHLVHGRKPTASAIGKTTKVK